MGSTYPSVKGYKLISTEIRIHLCQEVIRRVPRLAGEETRLLQATEDLLQKHRRYVREHFADLPEIENWVWSN